MRYCEQCGKPINDDAVFCSFCGTKVPQFDTQIEEAISNDDIVDNYTQDIDTAYTNAVKKKAKKRKKKAWKYSLLESFAAIRTQTLLRPL